jgi:hypothetical protein
MMSPLPNRRLQLRLEATSMSVRKRKNRWHYDFQVRGKRYRGSIPEARNKAQAERAEAQIKLDLFE